MNKVEPGRSNILLRTYVRIFLILLLAVSLSACTLFREKTELSAEANYKKGMKEFEEEDFTRAIPYFQKVLENYPFSMYAVPAELKIAESYFYDEKYVEALVHLQGFEELHPTNDQIPKVIWMKAVSYYEQFTSIDRDVSCLENARRELEELDARFPDSPVMENAEEIRGKVMNRLARHDFYVARFYYRDAEFQAALFRLYGILDEYRGEDVTDRTIYYIGKCHFFLQDNEPAMKAFNALLQHFPDSKYVSRSKMFMRDIEKGRYTMVSRYFRFKERVFGYVGYE
jgi:outer membrane protein assembly factor BamD